MINKLLLKKLTSENVAATLKQSNLASKNNIANFVNKTDFDNKLLIVRIKQIMNLLKID